MVWLSGLLPFEQSVEVMARIGERFIAQSTTWRMVKHYGKKVETVVEHQQDQVSVERIQLPDARHDHEQRKGISIDGGMVNIRNEGWRELKLALSSMFKSVWSAIHKHSNWMKWHMGSMSTTQPS
jgi:hypothetical protein